MTVGIPSFLTPPVSFGISTLLTGDGLYLPFLILSSSSLFLQKSFRLQDLLGGRNHLHLLYLLHLDPEIRAVLDFVLSWKLVRFKYALYAVSVPQSEVLPPTSFRLRLTTDALVFG